MKLSEKEWIVLEELWAGGRSYTWRTCTGTLPKDRMEQKYRADLSDAHGGKGDGFLHKGRVSKALSGGVE